MTRAVSLIDRHRESHPPSRSRIVELSGDINERIIGIYAEQSQIYLAHEAARIRHWAKYPTHFACTKCMDGRVHLPEMTKTPTGLVKPFRSVGGKFEVFWRAFTDSLESWVEKAMKRGARCFIFVTYHYSRSHKELGCAGWECDEASARAHTLRLSQDLQEIFSDQLVAVPTGVETDTEAFVLHGTHGDLFIGDLVGSDEDRLRQAVRACMPHLDEVMLRDLLPFLMGNIARVAELRTQPKDLSTLGHNERVLALGEAFNSIALQNFALITNDADPELDDAVVKAAKIIEKNLEKTSGEEATIFTNVAYDSPGRSLRKAVAQSQGLQKFAQRVIKDRVPRLWKSGRLRYLVGVTFESSKELRVLDSGSLG